MNWPATFGCFCLARTKLDNYHCVRTHCVGLTLLNCYPTFLLRKKELEQARQPYLFCARKKTICVAKAYVMIDVSTLSENDLPQRHAVGTFDVCLARPKNCPTDIVRTHAAQFMIDRSSVDHFFLFFSILALDGSFYLGLERRASNGFSVESCQVINVSNACGGLGWPC